LVSTTSLRPMMALLEVAVQAGMSWRGGDGNRGGGGDREQNCHNQTWLSMYGPRLCHV